MPPTPLKFQCQDWCKTFFEGKLIDIPEIKMPSLAHFLTIFDQLFRQLGVFRSTNWEMEQWFLSCFSSCFSLILPPWDSQIWPSISRRQGRCTRGTTWCFCIATWRQPPQPPHGDRYPRYQGPGRHFLLSCYVTPGPEDLDVG